MARFASLFFVLIICFSGVCESLPKSKIVEMFQLHIGDHFLGPYRDPSEVAGVGDVIIIDQSLTILGGNKAYYLYNSEGHILGKLPGASPSLYHYSSNRYLVLNAGGGASTSWVYQKADFQNFNGGIPHPKGVVDSGSESYWLAAGTIVGNRIFCADYDARPPALVSWEIGSTGDILFRNATDTEQWFNQHGDGVGGDEYISNLDEGGHFIGPTGPGNSQWRVAQMRALDLSAGTSLGIKSIDQKNSVYLGTDRKGIVYCYTSYPWTGAANRYPRDGSQVCLEIIDLWTKKATFRLLGEGEFHNPGGLQLAMDVGPDGTVEYTDVDLDKNVFILKKVTNDWWSELGLTDVQTAAVMDNRVRLRDKPSTGGQILDYLYDSDIVRIRAKSDREDTIDGVKAYWYQVDHYDGRHGWVFGAFLDIQK